MAISPGTYNITLQRRADYGVTLQFKDGTGKPIDLTGWAAAAQIWNTARTRLYTDFTVTYTDKAVGTIKLVLTSEQTSTLPDTANYDVLLTNPSGIKEYYLKGSILVNEGYTA